MPQSLSDSRWFARWLLWTVSFYPLFVAVQLLLRVLPAYLNHWTTGAPLLPLRLDPAGFRGPSYSPVALAVALLLLLLLTRLRAHYPGLAGRALAITGFVLLGNWTSAVLFRGAPLSRNLLPAALGFLLLCLGLRWAAAALPPGYARRAVFVAAAFALPALFLSPATLLPVALAALTIFGLPAVDPRPVHLRALAAGALATLVLFAALTGGRHWQQRQHQAGIAALLAATPPPPADAPFPLHYFHRGVNLTAHGYSYESEQARTLLASFPAYRVEAVALVPYGGHDSRTQRVSAAHSGSWESDAGVEILAASAHRAGMTVMLKPQLWPPPPHQPPPPAERAQWFREYTPFLEHYARLAQRIHADTLCIGVELAAYTGDEAEWRTLIARVRQLYKGPLVYAANHGPEFESIRFWDALDYIGLDNYYPLPDTYETTALVAKVEAVARRFHRPVLFTEAGYSAADGAHRAPWEDHPPRPLSLEEQSRCYEALLSAFYDKPWFAGAYWWKIETDGSGGPADNSMIPWGKPAMETMKRFYAKQRGAPVPGVN